MNATGSIARESTELRLEPAPGGWAEAMHASWRARSRDPRALETRAALGLPTDRPVVMTGHQPIVFHPGVLAKYFAATDLARATGAHAAFLVVDQDETDPGALRVPVTTTDGAIGERTLRLLPSPPPGVPAGWVSAGQPHAVDDALLRDAPWPFVREGVMSVVRSLEAHAGAKSLAAQTSLASFDLARGFGVEGAPVFASMLSATGLFADLIVRLRDDAAGFVRLHNDAVEAFPGAGVAALATDADARAHELPLWLVGPNRARRRVLSDQLSGAESGSLAPRALLMTLLARVGACDLFIHGVGGWEYDRITERLAREWLGVDPAPMALATATLRLPLLDERPPTQREAAHASWLAHRAAHDPALLGDREGALAKRALLERIGAAPRRGTERAALYRQLHALLERSRRENGASLEAIRARTAETMRRFEGAGLANDRTWAFALYPREQIASLARDVRAAIG